MNFGNSASSSKGESNFPSLPGHGGGQLESQGPRRQGAHSANVDPCADDAR